MDQSSNIKLCECGCGQPAPISGYTDRRKGATKGQPRRFIRSHNKPNRGHRRKSPHYVPEDRGYSTPCWIWQLHIDRGGYGHINIGSSALAHRVVYEQHKGPIPPGMQADHLCNVRCCVNPDHLDVVTSTENTRRGKRAKLCMRDAQNIRVAYQRGEASLRELAALYGVSDTAIRNVVKNRTWVTH